MSATPTRCPLLRTTDGGDTWTMLGRQYDYTSCYGLHLMPSRQGGTVAFVSRTTSSRPSSVGWSRSFDGGLTWSGLPLAFAVSYPTLTFSPSFRRDGTLFLSSYRGGISAVGPGLTSTHGSYPCPAPIAYRFAPVLDSDPVLRSDIGCPVEPEHSARVREQPGRDSTYGNGRFLWTEDDLPLWFALGTRQQDADGTWMRVRTKESSSWPDGSYDTLDGVIQPFEKGLLLSLARPNRERVILVLRYYSEKTGWRELPGDPGP